MTTVSTRGGGGASGEAVELTLDVNLPAPEIAQTAITHICPDQAEIKPGQSQLWGKCTTGRGTSITTCITREIEDSDKRATFSFLIVLVSAHFHAAIRK